jgi:transposase
VGALERTGVDWKPVSHVVSVMVEVHVANGHDGRQRPGTKTDKSDAIWIAELLAPGLITPRCVPPPAIRARRDLTRTRVSLVQTRTPATNRVDKMLEDTTIKVASVVSDVCGTSARRILEAFMGGERAP